MRSRAQSWAIRHPLILGLIAGLLVLLMFLAAGCGGNNKDNIPVKDSNSSRAETYRVAQGIYEAHFNNHSGTPMVCYVLTKEFSDPNTGGGQDLEHALSMWCERG